MDEKKEIDKAFDFLDGKRLITDYFGNAKGAEIIYACSVFAIFIIAYFLSEAALWQTPFLLHIIFGISMYIVAILVTNKFRKSVNSVANSDFLFDNEKIWRNYKNTVKNEFKGSIEKVIPLASSISVLFAIIVTTGLTSAEMGYTENLVIAVGIPIRAGYTWLYMVESIIYVAIWVFNIAVFADCMTHIIHYFKFINRLGQKKEGDSLNFPLSIDYGELQRGVFSDIGTDILSVSIPIIVMGTITGIVGLFDMLVYKNVAIGVFLIILCLAYDVIVIYLLYKETMHIHIAISDKKKEILQKAYDSMNKIIQKPELQSEDYDNLYKIQLFIDRVELINDWPFSATSLKKLLLTAGSSIVPLALSFFGIQIG